MIVLDAGALIAIERDDRQVWADLKAAAIAGLPILVPAGALAQVWRGSSRQALLSRALKSCDIESFDDVALEAGVLCGQARTADVVDASVAIVAARSRASRLYTSDPDELRHLVKTLRVAGIRLVPC